jgi:hypothetical protein
VSEKRRVTRACLFGALFLSRPADGVKQRAVGYDQGATCAQHSDLQRGRLTCWSLRRWTGTWPALLADADALTAKRVPRSDKRLLIARHMRSPQTTASSGVSAAPAGEFYSRAHVLLRSHSARDVARSRQRRDLRVVFWRLARLWAWTPHAAGAACSGRQGCNAAGHFVLPAPLLTHCHGISLLSVCAQTTPERKRRAACVRRRHWRQQWRGCSRPGDEQHARGAQRVPPADGGGAHTPGDDPTRCRGGGDAAAAGVPWASHVPTGPATALRRRAPRLLAVHPGRWPRSVGCSSPTSRQRWAAAARPDQRGAPSAASDLHRRRSGPTDGAGAACWRRPCRQWVSPPPPAAAAAAAAAGWRAQPGCRAVWHAPECCPGAEAPPPPVD